MKSFQNLATVPRSIPIAADDVLELHAARILLLIHICGRDSRIDGLTKLAKLDFFVRYPAFFGKSISRRRQKRSAKLSVESPMVRHHYGPWDKRYYHVLAFLESRALISVSRAGNSICFALTDVGTSVARELVHAKPFELIVSHMLDVKGAYAARSGTELKELIYKTFDDEVANRQLGEVIQ